MTAAPTFDDLFSVIARASVGDAEARVVVDDASPPDAVETRLAVALNLLLDDLGLRATQLRARLATIEAQQHTITALSTPVLRVADRVLLVPLVGRIDDARAQQMVQRVLEEVRATRARTVLVDLTGVPAVDASAAAALVRLAQAAALMGARAVLAGLSSAVAEALAGAGPAGRLRVVSDLALAIEDSRGRR